MFQRLNGDGYKRLSQLLLLLFLVAGILAGEYRVVILPVLGLACVVCYIEGVQRKIIEAVGNPLDTKD